MIKRILLICFNLIMIVLIIVSAIKGLKITNDYQIIPYKRIDEIKNEYEVEIEERDNLVKKKLSTAKGILENSKTSYENAKEKYNKIKEISSYDELVALSRNVEYKIEALWIKLDLPAKNNNLKANFQLQNTGENLYDINVTLIGDYLGIKNYIYDIRVDMDLQFKAENIIVEPIETEKSIITGKATFQLKNVKILM